MRNGRIWRELPKWLRILRIKLALLQSNVWVYIGELFVVSRLLYIAVGDVSSRIFMQYMPAGSAAYAEKISSHLFIQMWYVWDAIHYGHLASLYNASLAPLAAASQQGTHQAYYLLHWFPLYPLAGKLVHAITTLSIPYSLLISVMRVLSAASICCIN